MFPVSLSDGGDSLIAGCHALTGDNNELVLVVPHLAGRAIVSIYGTGIQRFAVDATCPAQLQTVEGNRLLLPFS